MYPKAVKTNRIAQIIRRRTLITIVWVESIPSNENELNAENAVGRSGSTLLEYKSGEDA
jgi:hypothetical protein